MVPYIAGAATRATVDAEGTVHVPAFAVPVSAYMSEESRKAFIARPHAKLEVSNWDELTIQQQREVIDNWHRPFVEHARRLYPVDIKEQWIAGIRTDVIAPKGGIPAQNQHRVLINLHGGSYSYATAGELARLADSVPIAGAAKVKVVSIDYKTSPKHRFPDGVKDVVEVYRALLNSYPAENIGIYGCSTGATLTANVVAWLQKERLPPPGAIGLFCGGATKDDHLEGDSYYMAAATMGYKVPAPGEPFPPEPYMAGTRADDPLVAPVSSPKVLSKFPPTLLITGTRDLVLSAAVYTHARLVKAGVEADLHVWDGMWHAFLVDPALPESREAYDVAAKFFDKHLGKGVVAE
jgi:epsilon-lactone hydrolase